MKLFSKTQFQQFPQIPANVFWVFMLLFLASLRTSFFLQINEYLLIGLFSVILYFAIHAKSVHQSSDTTSSTTFILLLIAAFLGQRSNLNGYIGIFIMILPVLLVLSLKREYKASLLQCFNKVLAVLVAISLLVFILHLAGVPIPYRAYEWKSYSFNDYFFFMIIPSLFYALERFQFVFTEPGYFGCLMVFMIFLNKYDFKKWEVWVYFLALIFTYSLAGYIFFFFGLAPFVFHNSQSKFKYLFILVLLLGGFIYLNGSSEENFVTQMFSYRIRFENGSLSDYNRTTESFELWFSNSFINSGQWLFGANDEFERIFAGDDLVGVDLRTYIARYGIVPLFFYFGSMYYYFRNNKSKFGIWYSLIFAFFYYRGYTVLYYIGFPILYYMGIQMLKIEEETGERVL